MKPNRNEYPEYYQRYIDKVQHEDLLTAFSEQEKSLRTFLAGIPADKADYAYAEGKWTVKQLLQHITDAERIFAYRALWIARNAPAALPGFEEDDFAREATVSDKSLQQLIDDLLAARASTYHLFKSFTEEMLQRKGIANNLPIIVSAIGFITLGHFEHHKQILQERYGI